MAGGRAPGGADTVRGRGAGLGRGPPAVAGGRPDPRGRRRGVRGPGGPTGERHRLVRVAPDPAARPRAVPGRPLPRPAWPPGRLRRGRRAAVRLPRPAWRPGPPAAGTPGTV